MDASSIVVLAVMLLAFGLFVSDRVAVDLVGLLVMVALVLFGVLTPEQTLAGFGNPALVTVAAMFVLSAGLARTGAVDGLTHAVLAAGGGKRRRIAVVILTVAVTSAFMNNTPVAIIFLPVVLSLCRRLDVAPSRLLMPMSFATILGGTCTLIGTSTNVLVAQSARKAGLPDIGLFDFAVPGLIYATAGLGFLALAGPRLLPRRASAALSLDDRVREYVTEVVFPPGSAWVGRGYAELLRAHAGIVPLMVIRDGETHTAPLVANPRTQFIRAGDALLLKGAPGAIGALRTREGIELPPELGEALSGLARGKHVTLAEAVVLPNSAFIGRTLHGTDFSRRHGGASAIAVLRREGHLRERVGEIRLQLGDTLLVVVDEEGLAALRRSEDLVLLEGAEKELVQRDKAPLAGAILAAVVVSAALGWQPIVVAALAGAVAMVVTRCLPLRRAYNAIDLPVLVLIAGMLALAEAFDRTGLAARASGALVDFLRPYGPHAVLAGIFLFATSLTAFVSNNAVAVLLTPVAVQVGAQLGLSPWPFVYGVLFGASCDFSTPVGYQTNLFVFGPGGYRFSDYPRVGIPLTLVLFLVSMLVIPWWFPFLPATS